MTLGNSARPAPWTIIGYRSDGRPIHLLAGGSGEEEDDAGIDVGDDDTEEDVDEEPDAGVEDDAENAEDEKPKAKPKPAVKAATKGPTEADLTRVTGALEKEREANKANRARIRELEAADRAAKKAAAAKPGEDEATVKAVEAARAEEQDRYKPMLVNREARLALIAAGLSPDTSDGRMKHLLKMVDMADVDVYDDGEVSGLEAQIDQIKETLPELFRKPEPEPVPAAPKIRAPKVDAADRKNVQPEAKHSWEKHAAQILGDQ